MWGRKPKNQQKYFESEPLQVAGRSVLGRQERMTYHSLLCDFAYLPWPGVSSCRYSLFLLIRLERLVLVSFVLGSLSFAGLWVAREPLQL